MGARSGSAVALLVSIAAASAGPCEVADARGGGRQRADLKAVAVSRPPATVDPGSRFRVRDEVENVGTHKAGRSKTLYYLSTNRKLGRADTRLLGRRRVPRLRPGQGSRGHARLTVPRHAPAGRRHLLACADGKRKLRESKQRNNCRAASESTRIESGPSSASTRPNILLVLTDDQAVNLGLDATTRYMPETRRLFGAEGVSYPNAVVTTPLCCPSRASIFSGKYAHNHGVLINDGRGFNAHDSWQRLLHAAGYGTGMVGTYLAETDTLAAPYFDYRRRADYEDPAETRLARGYAAEFLATAEADDSRPWALEVAVTSPHVPLNGTPEDPDPDLGPFSAAPAYGEPELADKHPAVLDWADAGWDPGDAPASREPYLRELEATDELIAALFERLESLGETRDTLAFFLSDNGFLFGEHRLSGKMWPYLESVRVPFYVRWPGRLEGGSVDPRLAANIDIAPTIYDAAGIVPDYPVDGSSLLDPVTRQWILTEFPMRAYRPPSPPPWSAYLSPTRHYIEWADGFVEDYDLSTDRAESTASNVPDPSIATLLAQARGCRASSCP